MKKFILSTLALALIMASCTNTKEQTEDTIESATTFPERAKDMNIYEVNIRQYTPEGTLKAFQAHLPRLQEMGVDMLWFMPLQPISEKNRKGPLGSYYSIADYTAINPNFGSLEDFKALVRDAHERDMVVILDWVANHTGFDHPWTEKEGYHTTDSAGNIIWPKGTDWTDVADLNYDNQEMRQEMIQEMKWWLTEADIDGFRCDVAGEVPNDFWSVAIDTLEATKDVFMLAEWDEPRLHEAGFHMTYGWGPHHWMNETAKNNSFNADSLEHHIKEDMERYPDDAFRMMFTTNHDENSWNGTVFERYGDGHKAYAAFIFTAYGMPLIYSGQEAGLDKRLRFFNKDTIDWADIKYEEFYKTLIELKKANPALYNGSFGAEPQFIGDNNEHVFSFVREKENNRVIGMINFRNDPQTIMIDNAELAGTYEDYFTNREITIAAGKEITLAPFEYLLIVIKS